MASGRVIPKPAPAAKVEPKAIALEQRPDKTIHVAGEWPKAALIAVGGIGPAHGKVLHCGETIRFEVANGFAAYKPRSYDEARGLWTCDLVDSKVEHPSEPSAA